MQPVNHCIDYYQHQFANAEAKDWPHWRLRQTIDHYQILNARRSLRDEDAENKLLEVGELENIPFDPPYKKISS